MPHPEGGETLVYTDEQGRPIDMGCIPLGGAVFSAGEGLAVRRHLNGQLLIESDDGLYRLFEPTPPTRRCCALASSATATTTASILITTKPGG